MGSHAGKSRALIAFALFVGTGVRLAHAAAPAIYNLGTLPSGGSFEESDGFAVNASGQVAGSSWANNFNHAFRYDGIPGSGGVMRDLGTLGGTGSYGYAINAGGQVAGSSQTFLNATTHAFRYMGTPGSGGVMHDLGTLGGSSSQAYAVNDGGQVTGYADTGVGFQSHAFRYTGTPGSGGAMVDLGALNGTGQSVGRAINGSGQVAGWSNAPVSPASGGQIHAFRYTGTPGSGGIMADLGTLGDPDITTSMAFGINASGQVAGWSYTTLGGIHAFRYDGTPGTGGVMRDLGTLGGGFSYGHAINAAGQVAGSSYLSGDEDVHASLYTGTPGAGGQMLDLDTWLNEGNATEGPKWTLIEARGVSDTGWITGYGAYDPDGPGGIAESQRAFLLDASALVVPEPGGLALLALVLPVLRRRRATKSQLH